MAKGKPKPLGRRIVFWVFVAFAALTLASFTASKLTDGGLVGAYRPVQGKAISEAQLAEVDARLGIGFIGTELIGWTRESLAGNFGPKPIAFISGAALFGAAWLVMLAMGGSGSGRRLAR